MENGKTNDLCFVKNDFHMFIDNDVRKKKKYYYYCFVKLKFKKYICTQNILKKEKKKFDRFVWSHIAVVTRVRLSQYLLQSVSILT